MSQSINEALRQEIDRIREDGLFKSERIIASPQSSRIQIKNGQEVLNFCANNYLGLSSHEDVIEAAKRTIDSHGYGMSSVRFICGTQDIHKELERRIADFVGQEDAILYAAAFDANGGLFEPLLGAEDAIVSDQLNHASIIDGVRLCKAQRYRYANNDMNELEAILKDTQNHRRRMIATDGVFSMDGVIAKLSTICDLAEKYDALVMVDECHATGFIGPKGRGTIELEKVMDRVDIVTGTFGKALGGASGGFTAASEEIVTMLRQRSRPYLFSNTLAPSIVGGSLKVLDILTASTALRDRLEQNTGHFRKSMTEVGFDIIPGVHPIVPIMLYDAALSQRFAEALLGEGIYVIGFFFPVVPKGKARIRVQISAGHSLDQINTAVGAFSKIGRQLGVIS